MSENRLAKRRMRLLLALEAARRVPKTRAGKQDERARLQRYTSRTAQADRGPSKAISLPCDWVRHRRTAEPFRKRLQRVKDVAGEQEHKIEDRRYRIEDVVSARAEREDRVQKEPSCGPHNHYQKSKWHAVPAQMNMKHQGG